MNKRHLGIAVLLLPFAALACSSETGDEPVSESRDALRRVMSRKQVVDGVKTAAQKRGITNTLLVAGIPNHETNLAHCVDDYYVQDCKQTAGTARSKDCKGGSVTVGNADVDPVTKKRSCDQGGLGLFQIDRGTQAQTIAAFGQKVLEVEGNTDIGIDYILDAVWRCDLTPNWGSDRAAAFKSAVKWINARAAGRTTTMCILHASRVTTTAAWSRIATPRRARPSTSATPKRS
jgi:hypothetical protein